MRRAMKSKRACKATEKATQPVQDCCPTDEELAKLAWAVAHPARVRLLRILLACQACNCGELVAQMFLAQSTVSQHLKTLKESGLIQGEIDGPKVCYCVNPAVLARLKELIAAL